MKLKRSKSWSAAAADVFDREHRMLMKSQERREQEARRNLALPDIVDFVPQVSPRYGRPFHLEPMFKYVRNYETEPFEIVFSVPPRHGKTESLLHVIPWILKKHPELVIAYATYAQRLSLSKSRKARDLAIKAGIKLKSTNLNFWQTVEGGGMIATSIGGPFTGEGCNILIIDDPTKDRATAESSVYREKAWEWFTSTAYTRVQAGHSVMLKGGSVIVCGTRWHEDDLQGRLIAGDPSDDREPWPYVCMQAIYEGPLAGQLPEPGREVGSALWPDRWPREVLEKRKRVIGPYDWASLFQGSPRPKGGSVFNDVHYWTELPKHGYRVGIGLDLAYSEKTTADYSVVVLAIYNPANDSLYILDVVRVQMKQPDFKARIRPTWERYPNARWRLYGQGPELGSADFLRHRSGEDDYAITTLEVLRATTDKFVRSQRYAATWNGGRVLLPDPEAVITPAQEAGDKHAYSWVNPFIKEHMTFTGVKDKRDDQVDAAVGAHDLLVPIRENARDFDKLRGHSFGAGQRTR